MPPRRSSRAAPTQLVSKAAPHRSAEKSATKPRSQQPARKRAASPDRNEGPAPKRTRTTPLSKKSENVPPPPAKKPLLKAASVTKKQQPSGRGRGRTKLEATTEALELKAPKEKKEPKTPKEKLAPIPQSKPYFNPLPAPPPHERPGLMMFAWGTGNFGQFGMGPDVLAELPKPRRNPWVGEQISKGAFGGEGAGLESLAAGGLHTLFTDEKGTVWSCGVNDNAALGRITDNVPDPNNEGSFLDIDELTSWPRPVQALVDENFRAVHIAAGDSIGAAVSNEGDFRVWGTFRGMEGALGFSDGKDKQDLPTSILELSHKPGDYEKVTSVASGTNHLLICTTHGNLYTLGTGEQGQLGRKIIERRKIHGTHPAKINLGTRSRKVVNVAAGSYHSFAIDDRGDVWGWGSNAMGQTGAGWSSPADDVVLLPKKVENLSRESLGQDKVVQISGGEHHTLFLTEAGKVYACGRMDGGQLGLDEKNSAITEWKSEYSENNKGNAPQFLPVPTLVTFPDADDPVSQVSCGLHNSAAVTRNGALYSWGQGAQGELGCDGEELIQTPRVVVRREGGAWFAAAVSCGGQHTLALLRKRQ